MGRCNRQAEEALAGALGPGSLHREHIGHRVAQVGHRRGTSAEAGAGQPGGQAQQAGGIGLVRRIPHGDQGRIGQAQPGLQHVAAGGGLGAADEAVGQVCRRQGSKEGRLHQQGLPADEAPPQAGIASGIAAEIEAVKHCDQRFKGRQGCVSKPPQQLQ